MVFPWKELGAADRPSVGSHDQVLMERAECKFLLAGWLRKIRNTRDSKDSDPESGCNSGCE